MWRFFLLPIGLLLLSGCGSGLCIGICAGTNAIVPASGDSLSFGTRLLGTSDSQTFALSNQGRLDIRGISVTGPASPFEFVGGTYPGTGGTCGDGLPSGTSCTVNIRHTATAPTGPNVSEIHFNYPLDGDTVLSAITLTATTDNGSMNRSLGADGRIYSVVPTSEGAWIAGQFARYSTRASQGLAFLGLDGELSTTVFAPAFNGTVFALGKPADGSTDVYAVGIFSTAAGAPSSMIARINSDGTIDSSFNVGSGFTGTVALTVAPLPDGDVYVGGIFSSYQGTARQNVIRLNSDGSVDPAFDSGVWLNDEVDIIAPFPDASGDLLVGGTYTSYLGYDYLVRLNSNGSVDPALPNGFDNYIRTLAFLPSGTAFYAGGDFSNFGGTTGAGVMRLSTSGVVDTTFVSPLDPGSSVTKILPTSDGSGKIYVAGALNIGPMLYHLVKLNADGTLDASFQKGDDLGPAPGQTVDSLAEVGDGTSDVWVAGEFASYGNRGANSIARISSSGSPRSLAVHSGFNGSSLTACLPKSSGQVYFSGGFDEYDGYSTPGLVRLNADGSVDSTFATGTGLSGSANSILEDSQGRLAFLGPLVSYQGTSLGGIVRLLPTGEVDPSFSIQNFTGGNPLAGALAPDGSNRIYAGGSFSAYAGTSRTRIARILSDGTLDTGFAGSGASANVRTIEPALDGSGDVYLGGEFATYNGTASAKIVRANADGSKDTGFAEGSGFAGGDVFSIRAIPDGSGDIYVGGSFTTYQGNAAVRVVRLNPDGTMDGSFSSGAGPNNTVRFIALSEDGTSDVFLAGLFSSYQGQTYGGALRLNNDGSVDASWQLGGAPSALFASPALDGSGEIYFGPNVRFIGDRVVDYLARLTPLGTFD